MHVAADVTVNAALADTAAPTVEAPQLGRRAILATWAASALPMGALAWLVAPALESRLSGVGGVPMFKALSLSLGLGLVWQFFLVVILVGREQRTLRWSSARNALWLRSPRSPRTGRVGGPVWLILIPLVVAFMMEGFLPTFPHPVSRDLLAFLASNAGKSFLAGNWGWFAVLMLMVVFNTVLGEELLFRGYLLPRMNGAFGRGDWWANGVLFAAYHLHMPWALPAQLADAFVLSYPTKRYRSAWIGIAVHSVQSVVLAVLVLTLVLR